MFQNCIAAFLYPILLLQVTHLMTPSVMYNFDASSLALKIVEDIANAQLPSGLVPDIAPEYVVFDGGFRDSPEWGSALLQLPGELASHTSSLMPQPPSTHSLGSLLDFFGPEIAGASVKKHYSAMVKYVQYLLSKRDSRGLLAYGLGDWCDANSKHGCDPPGQLTPLGVTGTCLLFSNCALLSRFASVILQNASEAEVWAAVADSVRADYLASPLWPPFAGSQTSPAMPLAVGLLNNSTLQQTALDALVSDIQSRGFHQTGGDIGHRFILNALGQSAAGNDIVARITNSTDFPSYGALLYAGASSLPEQWDGSGSQLHSMLGHVDEWFYRYVLGFTPPYATSALYPTLLLAPQPVQDLEWAQGHWRDISIRWQWLADTPVSSRMLRVSINVSVAHFSVLFRPPLLHSLPPLALFEDLCDPSHSGSSTTVPCTHVCNLTAANCQVLKRASNGDVFLPSGTWILSALYVADHAL
jgi:alpha-L-rhamnosidase